MTRRSKAPAPTGPLVDVFGVRHLSPNGAWQLERHLAAVDPTAVLVEGPSDATGLLEHFAHAQTAPPVAILAWTRGARGAAVRSVAYPFARYSPEWVAATWGLSRQRLVRFIDVPAATLLAMEPDAVPAAHATAEAYQRLAEAHGDRDHDTWWERRIERAGDGYREAVAALGQELRAIDPETAGARVTLLREAYMRRAIRKTLDEGHDPSRVVVVCGAFHASALVWELDPMGDGEARRLPRCECAQMLIPYGNFRLSTQGGNDAGHRAPAYQAMLYDALRTQGSRTLATRFMVRLAMDLRRRGSMRSSAEVIEAVRLAEAMATLADASAPALADLHDAAVACLGGGDAMAVRESFAAVSVGDAVGSLPRGIARTSLQDDVQHQLDALRLASFVKDGPTDAHAPGGSLVLDRRINRHVKRDDAAVRERARSVLLHRLAALDVGLAHDITTAEDRRDNTFKERWRLAWSPECELGLIERAVLGDTVEAATERHLLDQIEAAATVGAATSLALRARDCDLGHALDAAVARVQSLAVDDAGFHSVAGAVWKLARMIREPDVTGLDVNALRPLLAQLFLRATLLVGGAACCDDAAARAMANAMDDVHRVACYDWDDDTMALERWWLALDGMADDDAINPYLAGVSCALMIEHGKVTDATLAPRVARRISAGVEPARVAGWFEGLASRNPYALLRRDGLWRAMFEFVDAMDERAFRRALPGLRRAFSGFSAGDARAVAATLAGLWRPLSDEGGSRTTPETVDAATEAALDAVLDGIDFDL